MRSMWVGSGLPLAHAVRESTPAIDEVPGALGSVGVAGGIQIGPGRLESRVPPFVAQPPSTSKVPPRKSRRVDWSVIGRYGGKAAG